MRQREQVSFRCHVEDVDYWLTFASVLASPYGGSDKISARAPLESPLMMRVDIWKSVSHHKEQLLRILYKTHLPIKPRTSFAFCFAIPANSLGDRVSTSISSSSSIVSSSYLSTFILLKLSMSSLKPPFPFPSGQEKVLARKNVAASSERDSCVGGFMLHRR